MTTEAQTHWSWGHAAYLFLAGLGAAAYVVGVVADFSGAEWLPIAKIGVVVGLFGVLVGAIVLFADLGRPMKAFRAPARPGTSWISRGSMIVTCFLILAAIHFLFWIWPSHTLAESVGGRHVIGVLGLVFGFGVMTYTGFLLGAARPIAAWSTAMLPLVFLVGALLTGVMAVILVASLTPDIVKETIRPLEKAAILLIILELFALIFYVHGTHRVPESRASAALLLTGAVAPLFWFGVVIVGLLLPLALELLSVLTLDGSAAGTARIIAAVAGVLGGLMLRQSILTCGVFARLKAGRFEISVPYA